MKTLRAPPHVPRHSLLHPERAYVNAASTSVALTFARIRREQKEIARAKAEQTAREHRVLPLKRRV